MVVFSSVVGLLAAGANWMPYCRALEAYLQQVAGHALLSRTPHLETFLTSPEVEEEQRALGSSPGPKKIIIVLI